jgi:hypothetical protein
MERTPQILNLLLKHGRPEILKEFRADSCIVSTIIGIDVLSHFNVLANPLPVQVTIWNPAFCKRIQAGQPFPKDIQELDVWVKEDGAWNVGLGLGGDPEPGKWPGHLAVLAEGKYLIDLSLDQASRPHRNINLEPLGMLVTEEFVTGKEPKIIQINDCVLRFLASPGNLGYSKSSDWSIRRRRADVVSAIIRKVGEELK